jgi:DNA-binding transcriptional regulator YiaG
VQPTNSLKRYRVCARVQSNRFRLTRNTENTNAWDERLSAGVDKVRKGEFSSIRSYLGKTQKELAQLLGTSLKAVQSFEQGWRRIPVHVERQVLFLLAHHLPLSGGSRQNCWAVRNCPKESKQRCPAWEYRLGHLCWFINGTVCHGKIQGTWEKKMALCRKCEMFQSIMPSV